MRWGNLTRLSPTAPLAMKHVTRDALLSDNVERITRARVYDVAVESPLDHALRLTGRARFSSHVDSLGYSYRNNVESPAYRLLLGPGKNSTEA